MDRVTTGTVTFFDGTTVLGNVPLDAAGRATWTVPGPLGSGSHDFRAIYNGDPDVLAPSSSPSDFNVAFFRAAGGGLFTNNGKLARDAELFRPQAIAADAAGDLFIADYELGVVYRVDHVTKVLTVFAGTGQNGENSGDGGPGEATLDHPDGLSCDAAGNLYINTVSGTVREINLTSGVINTAYKTSVAYAVVDGAGDLFRSTLNLGGPGSITEIDHATGQTRTLYHQKNYLYATPLTGAASTGIVADPPAGNDVASTDIAVDPFGRYVYCADSDGLHQIAIATGQDTVLGHALGAPLAADDSGHVYLSDGSRSVGNRSVRMLDVATGVVTTVAGTGMPGYSGDGGAPTAATLRDYSALALDGLGDLFILDSGNNVVREVNRAAGAIFTVAGNGSQGTDGTISAWAGDGGPATSASIQGATSVAADALGDLFITDVIDHLVREVQASTGAITTIAGNGHDGNGGDGGLATSASLEDPTAVALNAQGTQLYIADDQAGAIRVVDLATGVIHTAYQLPPLGDPGSQPVTFPQISDMKLDAQGNVYLAEPWSGVVEIHADTGAETVVISEWLDPHTGAAGVPEPEGLAFDASGHLFISNDLGYVRELNLATHAIQIIAGFGNGGDGGLATSADLQGPRGLAVVGNTLYIADSGNGLIRRVNLTTGIIDTVWGVASPVGPFREELRSQGDFPAAPSGLAADAAGNVYFTEAPGDVVLGFSAVPHDLHIVTSKDPVPVIPLPVPGPTTPPVAPVGPTPTLPPLADLIGDGSNGTATTSWWSGWIHRPLRGATPTPPRESTITSTRGLR
jgi:sugar lactone lactonase YvrE